MTAFGLSVRLLSRNIGKELKINIVDSGHNKINFTATNQVAFKQFGRNYSVLQHLHKQNAMNTMVNNSRSISIQEVTKNIQLFTQEPRKTDKDPKTLKLKTPLEKPLVIICSWLLAKQKHLSKYAEIYIDQGFDVISVTITPWQLLWPIKGSQIVAAEVLSFLENNAEDSKLLIHGFSVGAYFWGECMVHMARDMNRYKNILDRICGQVWDSAADVTEITVGVPKAVFPRNMTLQKALRGYMIYHLKTFHDNATTHYIRSSQMFHSNLVKCPAIFLLSKTDPIGAMSSNQRVRESWESMGIQCTWKCWDKSSHVSHFQKHKEEYLEYLYNHLIMVNVIKYPGKIRAKL